MDAGLALWIGLGAAVLTLVGAVIGLRASQIQLWIARRAKAEALEPEEGLLPASTVPRPHPFVNRNAELKKAMDRICERRAPVLAFEGAWGIGKSAAVGQLVHELRQLPSSSTNLGEYEFVWVGGRDGTTTLVDIGRSLCMETDDQSVSSGATWTKLNRLRGRLASRKTALVLDDLTLGEDSDSRDMREFLGTVPDGSLVIAAVNRGRGLEAACIPLDEFGVEDVHKLIAAQVENLQLEPAEKFDKEFARRLYEIAGGHPRTIVWFLLAYKSSGQTVEERLEALRRGDGLEELFASIWSSLSDELRQLLRACECSGGRATAEQLAIACDVSVEVAHANATKLLDEGLLGIARTAGKPAFVCSQALALFIASETSTSVRCVYWRRLARYYVAAVKADAENARALLPEVDIIRAVFEGLARPAMEGVVDPELEADVQSLFEATLDILLTLGLLDDRLAAAQHGYDSAMRTGNYRCASLASEVLAGTFGFRGEFEHAWSALGHGWLAAQESGDLGEIARQMYTEGFIRYREGDAGAALESVQGADRKAEDVADSETLVNVLDLRAAAHLHLGQLDECEEAANRCMRICEEIRWERAKAFPLRFLAEVAIHRGESQRARDLVERARGIASEYHDQRQTARVSLTAARMYLLDRDLDSAEPHAATAASEAERLGLPPEEEEARALEDAIRLARRSSELLDDYARRRPIRLTDAPVAGD
jgi:tetratricopeptide (TPR) repeat protein